MIVFASVYPNTLAITAPTTNERTTPVTKAMTPVNPPFLNSFKLAPYAVEIIVKSRNIALPNKPTPAKALMLATPSCPPINRPATYAKTNPANIAIADECILFLAILFPTKSETTMMTPTKRKATIKLLAFAKLLNIYASFLNKNLIHPTTNKTGTLPAKTAINPLDIALKTSWDAAIATTTGIYIPRQKLKLV